MNINNIFDFIKENLENKLSLLYIFLFIIFILFIRFIIIVIKNINQIIKNLSILNFVSFFLSRFEELYPKLPENELINFYSKLAKKNIIKYVIKKNIIYVFRFFYLLFKYIFIKNFSINLLLSFFSIILYTVEKSLIGPFLGAILTFNLINGYSYYSKLKNFDILKLPLLENLIDFIFDYTTHYLHKDNFPIEYDEIFLFQNDEYLEMQFNINKLLDYYSSFILSTSSRLENKIRDGITINTNIYKIKELNEYLDLQKDKIKNNIDITMLIFSDNIKLIKLLYSFDNSYSNYIKVCREFYSEPFGNNIITFLNKTVFFILDLYQIAVVIDINDCYYQKLLSDENYSKKPNYFGI